MSAVFEFGRSFIAVNGECTFKSRDREIAGDIEYRSIYSNAEYGLTPEVPVGDKHPVAINLVGTALEGIAVVTYPGTVCAFAVDGFVDKAVGFGQTQVDEYVFIISAGRDSGCRFRE